ncbi:MAG: flagellar protein FlaG [Deferribacterales bacterium]
MIDAIKNFAVDMVAMDPQVTSKAKAQEQNVTEVASREETFKDLKEAIKEINRSLDDMKIARKFEIDKELDQVVVKILDTENNKVVRQIPSEDALRISKNIKEMIGLLFDSKL